MQYYECSNGEVRAIGEEGDIDGDQSYLIQSGWRLMTEQEFANYLNPPKTPEEIAAAAILAKKEAFMVAWEALVIEFEGNKYSCKKSSMASMETVINNSAPGSSITWYENWAIFNTTPETLGQVLQLAFIEKAKLEQGGTNV